MAVDPHVVPIMMQQAIGDRHAAENGGGQATGHHGHRKLRHFLSGIREGAAVELESLCMRTSINRILYRYGLGRKLATVLPVLEGATATIRGTIMKEHYFI